MQDRDYQPPQEDQAARTREGADEADIEQRPTAEGGTAGSGVTNEAGGIDTMNEATTADAGIAVDGGKLAGNTDDFEGELDARRLRNVPGADPDNEVQPPNSRDLRM